MNEQKIESGNLKLPKQEVNTIKTFSLINVGYVVVLTNINNLVQEET